MKILTPPSRGEQAQKVLSWREIKKDAKEMVRLIRTDGFGGRMWKSAYAVGHPQVVTGKCSENDPNCALGRCGHHKRFFVVNRKQAYVAQQFKYDVYINAVIISEVEPVSNREGCMSNEYAGTVNVRRFNKIVVEYYVPGWFGLKKKRGMFTGLASYVWQHELSHFRGEYL